ncbi:MAG TPA: Holliday junction branch migration protein RuvA [Planctomycetota bacterium]|nr:Holliday junction branch migration protein RuvA [Planctomycetota bacterium]
MYHHLSGKLVHKSFTSVVVDVTGVGYDLTVPLSTYEKLPEEGSEVRLLTHLHVREDGMRLFGFLSADERELFRMLIGVSGIGPMLALAVLSGTSVETVKQAVTHGDVSLLKRIRGVGTKTAERMVLELRDPVTRLGVRPGAAALSVGDRTALDAVAALVSLGYARTKAEEAVTVARRACGPDVTVEELVREALKAA